MSTSDLETTDASGDGSPRSPAPDEGTITRVGRYVLLERIGAGGVGIVYAAWDPVLSRRIALKLLRQGGAEEGQLRLVREAQAMARISHPNVVQVFDAGIVDGRAFVAMDFVDGGTLRGWLKDERPREEILDVFGQAARGLAAAHAASLVHRDFKPDNVLLARMPDGRMRAMVADFGLVHVGLEAPEPIADPVAAAERLETSWASGRLTSTGAVMGTPAYMSPEQFLGRAVDSRGDQFAFCVALYEAVYGERPFAGQGARSLALAVMQGERAPVPTGVRVPAALARVIERGLLHDPAGRHESMDALLDALVRARAGRRVRRLAIAAVPAALVLAWVALPQPAEAPSPCAATDAPILARWGDTQRTSVSDAFASTQLAYAQQAASATQRDLDTWAEGWKRARLDACEATAVRHEQSPELLDRRMACLDRELVRFSAVVDALGVADRGVVERATSLATSLPDLRACSDVALLTAPITPPNDAAAATVAELREATDRARADVSLGQASTACPALVALSARAKDLGYLPLRAEIELARGACETEASEPGARDTLERALLFAIESRDAATASEAARQIGFIVGVRDGAPDDGRRHTRLARALAVDVITPRADARIGLIEAQLELGAGDFTAARERIAHARAAGTAAFGERSAWAVALENTAGAVELRAGKYDAAQAAFERAVTIAEHAHGTHHPAVALPLNNLALALERQAQYDEAIGTLERAHEVLAAAHGAHDPRVGQVLHNIGGMYLQSGDPRTAIGFLEQAISVIEAARGADHATIAGPCTMLAEASRVIGRRDVARTVIARALAVRERAAGIDHPDLSLVLVEVARIELDEGRLEPARAAIGRALQLVDGHEIDPEDRGGLLFTDAQVLAASDRRDDAVRRADEAARVLETAGPTAARELAEVNAWRAAQ